jgi:1-acyl-sn-glycerol-3-phosphate acyltransferase
VKIGSRNGSAVGLLGGFIPGSGLAKAFTERWARRGIIAGFGLGFTLPYFRVLNKVRVEGVELLRRLPRRNVIFLANHQTYFLEAIAFYYLLYVRHQMPLENPLLRFSAAEETMRKNPLTLLMRLAGCVTFKRSFRDSGVDVNRPVDLDGVSRVREAISTGWLLHFPAGTTQPGAPFRAGVARILHNTKAVAVPVRVDGFRELLLHRQMPGKVARECSFRFHEPLELSEFYDGQFTRRGGQQVLDELQRRIGDPLAS